MKFNRRIRNLEFISQAKQYVPPIIFHVIVEPSENWPKEVGAYANVPIKGRYHRIDSENHELPDQFEQRINRFLEKY